jgi:arylsulfatase A-like enzyme
MGLTNLGWNLPPTNKTLPMYLRENGYTTHLVGLQHETNFPETLGYDTMNKRVGDHKYTTKKLEDQFIDFFRIHRNDDNPFYANFGTIEIHRPFSAFGDPVKESRVKIPPYLPEHYLIRKDFAEFYGLIENVDNTIGKIIKCLKEVDLYENTLFIFTTDHGAPFPRAKGALYDPGIKTLLIMHYPTSEEFSGGKVYNQILSNIDLLPTLLETTGGTTPNNIEGKSFLPLLRGETNYGRSTIFAEKSYHDIYDPIRGIRTEDFKFIFNFESIDTQYLLPLDIDRSYSGQVVKEFYKIPRKQMELYDLHKDPNEQVNLAYTTEYQDEVVELKQQLFNFLTSTNDPILKGKIPNQGSNERTYKLK